MMWEQRIDSILAEIGIPYYYGMPEFYEDGEPELYVVYTVTSVYPAQRADGEITAYLNRITLDIFGTSVPAVESLSQEITDAFEVSGIRLSGITSGIDSGMPQYGRNILEFVTITDR